jgi:hypothetical protein
MDGSPIRPNQQPLERQAALPNCDSAPCTDGRPRRNVKLPARLQDYVLEESYNIFAIGKVRSSFSHKNRVSLVINKRFLSYLFQ